MSKITKNDFKDLHKILEINGLKHSWANKMIVASKIVTTNTSTVPITLALVVSVSGSEKILGYVNGGGDNQHGIDPTDAIEIYRKRVEFFSKYDK